MSESPRHAAQEKLAAFLEENRERFDAPYGVIQGLEKVTRGKVRTITFGVSRYLDASIYVWSTTKITVKGQGALAHQVEGTFTSPEALIEHLRKNFRIWSGHATEDSIRDVGNKWDQGD